VAALPNEDLKPSYPDTDPGFYLDLARDQLSYQLSAADAVEAKAGTWFGVGSTLAGLLVAVLALKPPHSHWGIGLAALAGAAYIAMAVASMVIFFGSRWGTGTDVERLELDRQQHGWTDVQTKWVAFNRIWVDYTRNRTPYCLRLWGMRAVALSLFCQTLSLGVLALLLALGVA